MDTFYISGLGFLGTIGTPVRYRMSVYLEDNKAKTIFNGLDKTLCTYNREDLRSPVLSVTENTNQLWRKLKMN